MWSRGSKSNSTGVPTLSISLKSSSPPAGASSAARLGMLSSAACHSSSAAFWAASASLTSAASVLVWASSACFSSPCACGISLPSCFCSPRLASNVDDRLPPGGVGGQRPVHDLVGQPALGLGGTDTVGVVSEDARVDHVGSGYPG